MNLSYISVKNLFFVKIKNKRTKQDTSLVGLSETLTGKGSWICRKVYKNSSPGVRRLCPQNTRYAYANNSKSILKFPFVYWRHRCFCGHNTGITHQFFRKGLVSIYLKRLPSPTTRVHFPSKQTHFSDEVHTTTENYNEAVHRLDGVGRGLDLFSRVCKFPHLQGPKAQAAETN